MDKTKKGIFIFFLFLMMALFLSHTWAGETEAETDNLANLIDYRILYHAVNYGEGPVYTIGHKSPDSDAICSAIGYAEILRQLGIECEPRISARPNPETQFALDYFEVEAPEILEDASGKNIILVDHSMYSQAVNGMKDANIVGVLDHHSLGDVQSAGPLMVRELPIGATATGVYITSLETGTTISPSTAGLLATAILSDTNNLTSPTTTDLDREILPVLAYLAGLEDTDSYYLMMRAAKEAYPDMSDEEILLSDYKEFDMDGMLIGIGSVDASGLEHFEDMEECMQEIMEEYYEGSRLVHMFLMLNDYDRNLTELLYCGEGADEVVQDVFELDEDDRVMIDHVASRKLDIVPLLTMAYQDLANAVWAVDEAAYLPWPFPHLSRMSCPW